MGAGPVTTRHGCPTPPFQREAVCVFLPVLLFFLYQGEHTGRGAGGGALEHEESHADQPEHDTELLACLDWNQIPRGRGRVERAFQEARARPGGSA